MMTSDMMIRILAGVISTLGFAILFKLKPKHIPFSMLCGFVACVVYFPCSEVFDGSAFIPNFLAAFATALTAGILAIVCKTPSTVFLITGCITLVPGSNLFYAMSNLLSKNYNTASLNLLITLTVGVAIGGGILAASLAHYLIKYALYQYKKSSKK